MLKRKNDDLFYGHEYGEKPKNHELEINDEGEIIGGIDVPEWDGDPQEQATTGHVLGLVAFVLGGVILLAMLILLVNLHWADALWNWGSHLNIAAPAAVTNSDHVDCSLAVNASSPLCPASPDPSTPMGLAEIAANGLASLVQPAVTFISLILGLSVGIYILKSLARIMS